MPPTKKPSLLDKLRERNGRSGSLLANASAATQGMQAAGTALAISGGAGVVAGAAFSLAGIAVGLMVASFQGNRMRDEYEFIAQQVDQLPVEWAEDGTLDEHIMPAVIKYLLWRTQENHREKVQAARNHLAQKLMQGKPTETQDSFNQQVEHFLSDCTVSELQCLIRLALAIRAKEEFERTTDNFGQRAVLEEDIVSRTALTAEEGYYAFRNLHSRGFVFGDTHTSRTRERIAGPLPSPQDGGSQRFWSLTALGGRVAEWLDVKLPPNDTEDAPQKNGGEG